MSLRVWLPLNGNLNNQGVSNVTVTNSNATVDASGKIGSCYSFNGSTSCIDITYANFPTILNGDFSICLWIYSNDNNDRSIYFGNWGLTGAFFNIEKTANNKVRFYWNGSPDLTPANTTITASAWNHLVITRQGNIVKFYINGTLTDTSTTTLTGNIPSNATIFRLGRDYRTDSTAFNGKFNDFRLYDHCLSAKEVKEISKALICHYPLNQAFVIDNLVRNFTYSVYNNYYSSGSTGTITATGEIYNGCNVYRLTYTPNSESLSSVQTILHSHGICGFSRTFLADTKYCFWILYKPISHPDTIVGGTASNIGGFTEIPSKPWGGGWYICGQSRNGSVTTNKTDQIFVSFKTPSATAGTPITIDFCCPHLVLGYDYILPEYDYAGTNNLTIFDTSGYKNNGTKSGTLSSSIDSPKYEASTIFGDNGLIASPAGKVLSTSGNFTVAGWFYRTSAGSTYYASRDTYTTSVCLESARYFVYGTNGSAYIGNWTSVSDTWQHIVLVHDASISKLSLYVNGSYVSQISTSGNVYLNNTLDIGGRQGTNQYKGNISDFRIYATALSADDIKELYQSSASITNNGSILAYDFTEQ